VTAGANFEPPDDGTAAQGPAVASWHFFRAAVWRRALSVAAAVLLLAAIAPPFNGWLRRYEWTEALQFAVLAIAVPALLTIGAPWSALGLGSFASRLADARRRHPENSRTVAFVIVELFAFVAWRTPAAVNWIATGGWRVLVEAIVVVPAGVCFWLECVESPPLVPRSTRPVRIAAAAFGMWTIWVLAYLVGLSHADWYRSFSHVAGSGISLAADQQVTTGVLWFVAACAFIPVIFWNLMAWLRSEEDPDQELHRLAKETRRREAWNHARDSGV
jgi:cytochrome c oxidase assembly factor CtaG